MIELRDHAGFPVESLTELPIGGKGLGQDLDRDGAIQSGVAGLVDFAHPARTQWHKDVVWTEARAGSKDHEEPQKSWWRSL
jgi:hypothetical protein